VEVGANQQRGSSAYYYPVTGPGCCLSSAQQQQHALALSVWFEARDPSGHTTITTNSTTKTTTTVMDKTMLENTKDIKYEDYTLIQATGE